MNPRNLSLMALVVVFPLASPLAQAQSKTPEGVVTASYKMPNYKAPRTADGRPDLQGVWANNNATPLQRPKELEGKEFLSEQELTALKRTADDLFKDGNSDAAFGDAVFQGVAKTLHKCGRNPAAILRVGYIRNSIDVTGAVEEVLRGRCVGRVRIEHSSAILSAARPGRATGPGSVVA